MVWKSSEKVEKEINANESGSADLLVYGLGANDDGGSVVAMIEAYRILTSREQPYRLVLTLTAEEEVSGRNGIELILPFVCGEKSLPLKMEGRSPKNEMSVHQELQQVLENDDCRRSEENMSVIEGIVPNVARPAIALAIVGEPTGMQMAVAEKGLMVLDCTAYGKSGHAARNEGVNAIYKALPVVKWFAEHEFEKVSEYLGPVKMSVTQVQAGTQHNVVPDLCSFVVDVRANDCYTNEELLFEIKDALVELQNSTSENTSSIGCTAENKIFAVDINGCSMRLDLDIKARSTRLGSSHIDVEHPVVQRGLALGLSCFGSPTLSNQALLHCPSLKIGPGDSARSHTANEFIRLSEIEQAVDIYVKLLDGLHL